MPDIGKKIRFKREQLNMTQEELAKRLGYKSKTTDCEKLKMARMT